MIGALQRAFDSFAGRGEAAVTVPPMDGALRPNNVIETAPVIEHADAPDNLVFNRGLVWYSSGSTLRTIGEAPARHFDATITCTADGPGGLLAIGLDDGRVLIEQAGAPLRVIETLGDRRLVCPTALAFDGASLLVCEGSRRHRPSDWQRDVMERGSHGRGTGSVWRFPMTGEARCLADGLAWPYGLLVRRDGTILVSESWQHRLLRLPRDGGRPMPVLSDLPGYPARMSDAGDGGLWLAVFAPRSQLIEFVLRERGYRTRMMTEVPCDFWIAPALYSGRSFREPLQGGAVKQMGILKPWAPTRSYGLVLRLDADCQPVASMHSRADGARHGITSILADGARVLAAAKGGNVIIVLDAAATGQVLQ